MKKFLYIAIFIPLLLSGCEKKMVAPAPASLFQMNDETTDSGISAGDNREDFIKAYKNYTIQVAYRDSPSNYLVMSIEDIPYEDPISTMIANFFINGKPVSVRQLCEDNDLESSELHKFLSAPSYLRRHEVIYRYLTFDWEDGYITDIDSGELNYNETFETPCAE